MDKGALRYFVLANLLKIVFVVAVFDSSFLKVRIVGLSL